MSTNSPRGRFAALRPWILFGVTLAATAALWVFSREAGTKAVTGTLASLKEMLLVLPPIVIILGLLDVWVPRERMVKYLGEGSGLRGILIAFVLGSAAAGPLYGAFPVAPVLLRKGSSMRNVLILLGAWSTTSGSRPSRSQWIACWERATAKRSGRRRSRAPR